MAAAQEPVFNSVPERYQPTSPVSWLTVVFRALPRCILYFSGISGNYINSTTKNKEDAATDFSRNRMTLKDSAIMEVDK